MITTDLKRANCCEYIWSILGYSVTTMKNEKFCSLVSGIIYEPSPFENTFSKFISQSGSKWLFQNFIQLSICDEIVNLMVKILQILIFESLHKKKI